MGGILLNLDAGRVNSGIQRVKEPRSCQHGMDVAAETGYRDAVLWVVKHILDLDVHILTSICLALCSGIAP